VVAEFLDRLQALTHYADLPRCTLQGDEAEVMFLPGYASKHLFIQKKALKAGLCILRDNPGLSAVTLRFVGTSQGDCWARLSREDVKHRFGTDLTAEHQSAEQWEALRTRITLEDVQTIDIFPA